MRKVRISIILAVLPVSSSPWPAAGKGRTATPRSQVSGVIEAVKTDVRAQAQGEIEKVLVQEGQKVAKGDLLCRINADKLRIQIDQVRAGIAGPRPGSQLARIGTKKELIAVAKTQVEIAAKQLEIAEKDQERLARLLAEGAVSQSQKEKADLALKAAQEQPRAPRRTTTWPSAAGKKKRSRWPRPTSRASEAQEQSAPRHLRDTEVKSPGAGIVEVKTRRARRAGDCPGPCSSASSTSARPTSRPTSPKNTWAG